MTAPAEAPVVAGESGPPFVGPLSGFSVAVTAARRREELGALLERRGARVTYAPALRIVPLADDAELLEATRACLAAPLDVVVATTGIGFRGWMEAADGWGLGDRLRTRLTRATLLARGPKVRGAIRAAGLTDAWSPPSESSAEVLVHLLDGDLRGRRIAVQLHGEPLPDLVQALRGAGADVVAVPVYRWVPPEDPMPLRRLVDAVVTRQVDAVTFTSAPAAVSFLAAAAAAGLRERVLSALTDDVVSFCVGPVTAAPLARAHVPTVEPQRGRLGALAREIVATLPARRALRLRVAGRELEIRGHAVVVDGALQPVSGAPMAVLRVLAAARGHVVNRCTLLDALPGDTSDEHAVEVAVGRLRAALGSPHAVETVVKRGYRLAVERTSDLRPAR